MRFRKFLSLCLSISIFFQSIAPLMAMQSLDCVSDNISTKHLLSTAQEVEENLYRLRKYKSSPAPLTFWGETNKTAAGVLHFSTYQNEIYILLGKRNDEKNAWCNFGGGSDWENGELESFGMMGSDQSTISNTPEKEPLGSLERDAARESEEESNGIYTLHPRILKKIPFIDTFDPDKKMYHRMYWQHVQHINPDVFLAKLENAEHDHNKEYTDFKWISAHDLLAAVLEPQSSLRNEIYGPLLNTLSTESGFVFLTELAKFKKLNRYKPYIRPLCNRLYIFGNTAGNHDRTQVKWPAIDVNGQEELLKDQKRGRENVLLAEKELKSLRARKIFDSLYNHLDIALSPNIHETILLSTPQEEEQLAEAVAAHGMAMVEFKKRFIPPNQIFPSNTPEWDPDCSETLSRIHLRVTLGPDYKEPMSCSKYPDPQRHADIENIKLYFSRHKEAETGDKFQEFKREITLLDSDYEFFADVLDWETRKKIWPTFYHGASANVNNLFTSFTYLRQLINIDFNNGSLFLRGTDIYSHGIQNLRDFIEKNGKDESDLNRSAMLFMNFVLFAGLKTTNSTSSSAEYVLNDHSVQEVVLKDKFEEAMALAGFSNPHYGPFQSLYEQFKGHKDPKRGNSVLIAISQNPEGLDDYNYPTGGGGEFWKSLGSEESKEMPSSLKILQDIQAEHMRQIDLPIPESFKVDTLRKRALYPENRIYLEPKRMSDSNKIHIRSFDRFQLTREEAATYDREMRRASVGMASDWLSQKSAILEGSFASYPALKRLHKFVYQGLTGHPMEENLSPAGFIHLVRNGQLDGVKQFLDCFPKVLEHKGLTQQKLIEAASESQNPKLMQYLIEDVFKTNLQKTLGLDGLYLRIRRLLYEENPKSLPYLLSQLDSASIPDDVKLLWVRLADSPSSRLCILNHIQQSSPHLTFNAIEHCFKSRYAGVNIYKMILDAGLMTSQELLVRLYDCIMGKTATQYHETIMPLQMLLGNGADLAAQHPLTRTPLAFLLPEITDWLPQEITSLLENEAGYLKLVNKEGLTLLQAEQKKSLETQRGNGLSYTLIKLCQKAGLDYKTESYIPFIEYFGPLEHLPYNAQEFLNAPESLPWIERCQQVTSETVADLINTCPYPELLTFFEGKLSAFGLFERYTKRSELDKERDQWMIDTQRLLSDKPQLTQHLLNALSVNLRNVLYLLLNESYVDILPSVLERIYPTRKDFLVEKQTKIENGSHCCHPIMYIVHEKECKNVVECLLNFLGKEYIPQFLSNLQEYDMYSLLAHFPESKLLDIYESTPSLFIQVTEKKDAFKQMLGWEDAPLSLKRKIAMEHIEKLKIIANCGTGFPYFWHILFSGEKHIYLMKELIEQDHSLLYLKSIEGFTIQQLLSIFPKIPEVMALQRFFSNSANIDTISEYLPDHKVVYCFREIWEELSNKTIHLWSDIDEVMIYDKHFWRYNSLKSFIPRESHSLLGEYDHELLDEDAPEIFKTILKNNGRICGLTARPPESSKFESTYRRLSQSGLAFDGTQRMETVFTKEKFSHFDRDIFYCGDRDKGEVVLEAIDALYGEVISDNLPLFVFTDDLMENLIAISETLKDTRYKFVLYHFRGIDHKLAPYMQNPDLVRSAFQEFRLAKQNIIGS